VYNRQLSAYNATMILYRPINMTWTDCCLTWPIVWPIGASTEISIEQQEHPAQQLQPNTHLKSRRTRITSYIQHQSHQHQL